ncbi:MAG TPA: hydrolase [Nevskiaceae bacterium]|nr:hydrolase [Nevskiaceae bacterium]
MRAHEHLLRWIDEQTPAMTAELVELASINSGSLNAAGVSAVGARLAQRYAALGAGVETIEVAPYRALGDDGQWTERPLGRATRLRLRPDAPLKIFFCGHLDTVFGAAHPFQQVRRTSDDTLHGPGVADLKGGLLAMWLAIAALERSEWKEQIGWEVLLNPDEELGSQSSAPLLAEAAQRNHFALVYEPAFPDGHLAGERKGSGNFNVVVRGRAAHAGRDHHLGRNAIRACADFVSALDALNGTRDGLTINPGYVHGGGALNIVPDLALVKFNVRTSQPDDECWLHDQLDLLLTRLNDREGIQLELSGGFTRPPKIFDEKNRKLAGLLRDCGHAFDLELQFKPTGGCCDGNNLSALGLPNIDNLGVVGGEIHSDREFMRISSLPERAKLSALLLLRLASGEISW